MSSASKLLSLPLWGGISAIVAIAALLFSFPTKDIYQNNEADKELWSKNWEYLKKERLDRRSRDCNGMSGKYDVYDRKIILSSLESLMLDTVPNLKRIRNELVLAIKNAPKTTERECPTLGNFPNIDLLMVEPLNDMWEKIKVGVKAKATSAGIDVTFQWNL